MANNPTYLRDAGPATCMVVFQPADYSGPF